jgi:hypothetical protein
MAKGAGVSEEVFLEHGMSLRKSDVEHEAAQSARYSGARRGTRERLAHESSLSRQ